MRFFCDRMNAKEVIIMIQPPVFQKYDQLKKNIKEVGVGLWIYVGLQLAMGFFLGIFATTFFMFSSFPIMNFGVLIISIVSAGCVIFYLMKRFHVNPRLDMKKEVRFKEIFQALAVMMLISFAWGVVSIFLDMLLEAVNLPPLSQDLEFGNQFLDNFFLFLSVVVVAPIVEEIVFRGLIFKQLSKYHVGFAMVISSICFACMHMNVVQGIPTFFMGLVLAYSYWKTGSLVTSMGIHFLNNLFAMFSTKMNLSFITIVLILLAVYVLVTKRDEIKEFIHEEKIPRFYFSFFIKNTAILLFFILFILMAVISLF